ncbi:MAG: flagellar operon protein YvyF [Lachnospiraceae bacterium]|nr:flagellar operon protein YvyF [Lachnospiraceae bacterium]
MPDQSVMTCSRCGRVITYPGFGAVLCRSCRELDEEEFGRVRDYLNEHGTANMYEISEATGVTEKTIRRYLLESRLEIPEGSPIYIKCEVCGCDIRSGRYCPDCAGRLSSELQNAYMSFVGDKPKFSEDKSGKMHFLKLK